VLAYGSMLMGLHGIGPAGAARLLADVGDIRRFADRDRFASWNGTARLDASSGQQHRRRPCRSRHVDPRHAGRAPAWSAVAQRPRARHRTDLPPRPSDHQRRRAANQAASPLPSGPTPAIHTPAGTSRQSPISEVAPFSLDLMNHS
jgi:hypothetical protein